MWDRLSTRERIMILILFLVVVLSLYYYFIYQPIQAEIKELSIEKRRKEDQLQRDLVIVKKLPELRQRYDKLKEIEKIELKFSTLTPEDFLELIENISRKSGARLTAFIPEEKDNYISLNITMVGYYKNLHDFLSGLKKLANQIKVNTLTIKPYNDQLQMKLVLNYQKQKITGGSNL